MATQEQGSRPEHREGCRDHDQRRHIVAEVEDDAAYDLRTYRRDRCEHDREVDMTVHEQSVAEPSRWRIGLRDHRIHR